MVTFMAKLASLVQLPVRTTEIYDFLIGLGLRLRPWLVTTLSATMYLQKI